MFRLDLTVHLMPNRLIHEKSPYLLQHAHNPVDWYPWGEEAFEKARREDKPIFLSIGYSTCHWCHVMERESFESPEIAELLNRWFVPVKVDREERPDVDRIYMLFVQAVTGGGGWPMSVWLTPDLKPFYGGTYFPPETRWGRPGFRTILEQLAAAWQRDRSRIIQTANETIARLSEYSRLEAGVGQVFDPSVFDSLFFHFRRTYDTTYAGFGSAPKFPRPAAFYYLLRYWRRTRNQEALDMTVSTLSAMARGGIYDQLGGGFHRYSVDERWFLPHFEKMLYDQAQLAVSYLEAFQITKDQELAQVARETLDYVLRDMTHPEGGFYSAEDADSPDPDNPSHKAEGAFYLWRASELRQLLGKDADWFFFRFGVEDSGNVPPAADPHGEFAGRNILYQAHSFEETAAKFRVQWDDWLRVRHLLLEVRNRRPRPHRDDKILTGWNGLMISGLALGARVLDDPRYLNAAQRAVAFIESRLVSDGRLYRRWRDGEAAIPAFLDDYAFYILGLLDLYLADSDPQHIVRASGLARDMITLFEDRHHGAFFSTAEGDQSLVMRMKEDYDGAEPSGNSAAVLALLRLARLTHEQLFQDSAERALRAFAGRLAQTYPAMPFLLAAYLYHQEPPREVIITGQGAQSEALLREFHQRFLPFHELLVVTPQTKPLLAAWSAAIAAMDSQRPAAYLCENFTCQPPVSDPSQLAALLH
jgi:uncharacterized protein YyaL (SSP411 family)